MEAVHGSHILSNLESHLNLCFGRGDNDIDANDGLRPIRRVIVSADDSEFRHVRAALRETCISNTNERADRMVIFLDAKLSSLHFSLPNLPKHSVEGGRYSCQQYCLFPKPPLQQKLRTEC